MTFDVAKLTGRILAHIAPCRADRELAKKLDKLQDMLEKLQRSSVANPQSQPTHTEATLMQCARETIDKGTTMYEASLAAESAAGGQGAANRNIRVAEWVSVLESMSWNQRRSDPLDVVSSVSSIVSGDEAHTVVTSATSAQRAVQENKAFVVAGG